MAKHDPASLLFGDARPARSGHGCIACTTPAIREAIDNCLRGMLNEGPYAGRVPLFLSICELHKRLSDETRTKAAGIARYPRGRSAFEAHLNEHKSSTTELWKRVKAAKQAAGI